MSPKAKSSLQSIAVFVGAVVAVAGLTGGSKRLADSTYVRTDTFALYQQREAYKDSLVAQRHEQEVQDIKRSVADIDTGVRCLRGTLPPSKCRK